MGASRAAANAAGCFSGAHRTGYPHHQSVSMTGMPRPIVMDVDTGTDDALAILYAVRHPDLQLLGITCVAGNVSVDQALLNTCKVLDAARARDIPVAAGAAHPLNEQGAPKGGSHGLDGLGGITLPATSRQRSPMPAVEMLSQLIMSSVERVSFITLGPKTNLALLLKRYPGVVMRLEQIIFMGGSTSAAVPEFNIRHDPEAALDVIESAVPITMYGFDLFGHLAIDQADADRFRNHDHPAIRLTGELLDRRRSSSAPGDYLGLVGDAGAMVLLTNPELFVARELPVRIKLEGVGRGQTIVDRPATLYGNSRRSNASPMINVVLDLDAVKAASAFVQTISAYAASANNHS